MAIIYIGIDCAPGVSRPDTYIKEVAAIVGITEVPEPDSKLFGAWTWHIKGNADVYTANKLALKEYLNSLYNRGHIRGAEWDMEVEND